MFHKAFHFNSKNSTKFWKIPSWFKKFQKLHFVAKLRRNIPKIPQKITRGVSLVPYVPQNIQKIPQKITLIFLKFILIPYVKQSVPKIPQKI